MGDVLQEIIQSQLLFIRYLWCLFPQNSYSLLYFSSPHFIGKYLTRHKHNTITVSYSYVRFNVSFLENSYFLLYSFFAESLQISHRSMTRRSSVGTLCEIILGILNISPNTESNTIYVPQIWHCNSNYSTAFKLLYKENCDTRSFFILCC